MTATAFDDIDEALRRAAEGEPATAPPPVTQWPAPLAEEAFHGLAGEVVRRLDPHTEADPAALLLQFLAAFGNAIGRGPYAPVEGDKHGPNLFVAIVAASAKGRKGTSWGRIRQIMEDADTEWTKDRVQDGLASGEGLIWAVRDPIVRKETDKRTGAVSEVTTDPGVADKRLFVQEGELSRVLSACARDGSTLSALIRLAWDTGDLRSMTKNNPGVATGALVSIVGHITDTELTRRLDRTEAANGFANRFLFVCARRSKELPEGGGDVRLDDLADAVRIRLALARGVGAVGRTEAFRELWRDAYHELSKARPGLLGAVTGRSEAQVLRLALLYALLDGKRTLDDVHLLAALAVWDYCDASAAFIFGDALGDPVADQILDALRRADAGMSRTDISAALGRHATADRIAKALSSLAALGLARSSTEPTAGRPVERWWAA